MKDTQTMRKAVSVTMKKVTTIFVRRKSKSTRDGNSIPHTPEDENCPQIEDGLEVNEDRHSFSRDSSTEPSPEPLEMLPSSEDESFDYFTRSRGENQRRRARGQMTQNTSGAVVVKNNGDQQGACGPLTNDCENDAMSTLVPMNCDREIAHYYRQPENSCQGIVLTSCGELEMKCTTLPLELQAEVSVIKENLLWQYPPYYDFCIIASDDDYDEAIRFKKFVASSFGLAGCTLDDGFVTLGAELFDSYEKMMDQSSKVFFFVTENFTSNAFCKRIQSGAVFLCLMSKAQKDKEKCVPVFPRGFCRAPLALSGIAGLNPTQREVIRRSLDNTYSPLLRQRRFALDRENFKKRCLEFQEQVMKCIANYEEKCVQNKPSGLPEIGDSGMQHPLSIETHSSSLPMIQLPDSDDPKRPEEQFSSAEPQSPIPVILLPDNDDSCGHNTVIKSHVSESSDVYELSTKIKGKNETLKQEQSSKKGHSLPPKQRSSIENVEKCKGVQHESVIDDGDCSDDDDDDVLKGLPIPDKIREIMNKNTVSSVSIKDCATVQVGNTIQIIINQASSTDLSHLEHLVNRETTSSSEKISSEQLSDSD